MIAVIVERGLTMKKGLGIYPWYLVLQCIIYGFSDVVSKIGYRTLPVSGFLFLRYTLCCSVMLIIFGKIIVPELKRTPVINWIVPGVCMSCAFVCSNFSLNYTTAANMSFIRALSALIVPILSFLCFGKKIRLIELPLFAMVLLGLYLLCNGAGITRFGLGEVLALCSGTLVAGALVFGKEALKTMSAVTLSFVQLCLSIFTTGMVMVISGGYPSFHAITPTAVCCLLYVALLTSIGGYLLQNAALKHISPKLSGVIQCLYPILAAVAAWLCLNEKMSGKSILGAGIILLCVVAENLLERKETAV